MAQFKIWTNSLPQSMIKGDLLRSNDSDHTLLGSNRSILAHENLLDLHWVILLVFTERVIARVFSGKLKMSLEGINIKWSLLPLSKLNLLRFMNRVDFSRKRNFHIFFFLGRHRNKLLKCLVVVGLVTYTWLLVSTKISLVEEHVLPIHRAP